MVAAAGYIIVGHFMMAEVSGSWIRPKFDDIGYWIGLSNAIGAYGFMVCAIATIPDYGKGISDAAYKWAESFPVFWGSVSYWLGSVAECIEFASRHPIMLSTSPKPKQS